MTTEQAIDFLEKMLICSHPGIEDMADYMCGALNALLQLGQIDKDQFCDLLLRYAKCHDEIIK